MVCIITKVKNSKTLIFYFHLRFSMAQISLKLINTNNYGKETEENLTTLYLEQKNVNLVITSLVREVPDNSSVGIGKGKGGGLFIFVFFMLSVYNFLLCLLKLK